VSSVKTLLGKVTRSLPGGGEIRPGQSEMAEAVADAVAQRSTLLVEAGTGTGKSLAYLTPLAATGNRAVVATATIALQGQLVEHDIPQVAAGLGRPISAAVLKGRRNYLCRQRLAELERADHNEQLVLLGGRNPGTHLAAIRDWASTTASGDREELDPAPTTDVWSAVSVGPDECPGAARCPSGDSCFAEQARLTAFDADIIVTNHHYYGLDVASGGGLLPEHQVVVFDEAHQLADSLEATCGTEVSGGRLRALARRLRHVVTEHELPGQLDRTAADLDGELRTRLGAAADVSTELIAILVTARDRAEGVIAALRKLDPPQGGDAAARVERGTLVATNLVSDIDRIIEAGDDDVLWVDGTDTNPVLRRTPLDIGPVLAGNLWPGRAVVLTSATLADGVVEQLGLDRRTHAVTRVGSPFDYPRLGLLYCPTHLPDPRQPTFRAAAHEELIELARAAGGRTLALFTSYSGMRDAAEALAGALEGPVLVQGEAPREQLLARLRAERGAVLVATMSFWQGIDIAGDAVTLVAIDRLPFPRPDEPVSQARRDRAGPAAFRTVDLPRAQTLLAQAAGRLVRRSTDRGVVAVLDSRLATNRHYRWDLINALPPFTRTKDKAEVLAFLRQLNDEAQ
jgi:ATP-dependent DNA helicase DinG